MRFLAVTTFNEAGRKLYGQRMMESYRQFWPTSVPLVAYSEGWSKPAPGGVYERDLVSSSPWLAAFKARHAHLQPVSYLMDAVRFSHKVAALCHAIASNPEADIVIWLDGDIVTHSPIGMADLERLAPAEDQWIAWLNRVHMHPECGFYMINTRHRKHAFALEIFECMYSDDKLFSLKEWHDSYVLQVAVRLAGVEAKSLSGKFAKAGHPLINGPLGQWFDHLKGARKAAGRSKPLDLVTRRDEPYWNGGKTS